MKKRGWRQCTPRQDDPTITAEPWVDFSSGYIQRSAHLFAQQGSRVPWRLHQNYARDILMLRHGRVDDGVMVFGNPAGACPPAPVA